MGTKTFQELYKKSSTGAIQVWKISVVQKMGGGLIVTEHGQLGGKIQETSDLVTEGKNPGKANATTPYEQAMKEAEAKWTKQLKKGYVTTKEDAQDGKLDDLIEGGILPMLAPNKIFPQDESLAKKIHFPAFIQPKLDGMRCIAIIENGKATLWSRTRKPVKSVPHIVAALEVHFSSRQSERWVLDGELYSHKYRNNFEDLLSILRKDEPDAEGLYKEAEYHVYDQVTDEPFSQRSWDVEVLLHNAPRPIVIVPTMQVLSVEQALEAQEEFEEKEYEGAMIRNADGPYESGKRSQHLQKMKSFLDAEFQITGAEEGRGKDKGTVGAFVCVTPPPVGKEFRVRLKGTYGRRKELFGNPALYLNKKLTVRYKRMTADGVPYIPIGHSIRDYE